MAGPREMNRKTRPRVYRAGGTGALPPLKIAKTVISERTFWTKIKDSSRCFVCVFSIVTRRLHPALNAFHACINPKPTVPTLAAAGSVDSKS
jgi:hypothetical protein